MAFLDNTTITVQAILTKRGRELLAQNGNINITSFALSDDEIDYTLYQNGGNTTFNDLALRNTPVMEPLTDESQMLKHKLVSLTQGVTSIPVISVSQPNIVVASTYGGTVTITPSTTPAYDLQDGYTLVLGNKNVGTLIVQQANSTNTPSNIIPSSVGNINTISSQTVVGNVFQFIPNSSLSVTTTTNLTIIGNDSGASNAIEVTVTVPKS